MGRITGQKRSPLVGFILVVGLLVLLFSSEALAQPEPFDNGRQPSDYFFLEFAIGSTAGVVFEAAVDYALLSYFCGGNINPELCTNYVTVGVLGPYVPVTSQIIGSTAGVLAVGSVNRVQGNIPAMLIGTLSGSLAGIVAQRPIFNLVNWAFQPERFQELQANPNTPEFVLSIYPVLIEIWGNYQQDFRELSLTLIPPIIASFFGSIGFNIGASITHVE